MKIQLESPKECFLFIPPMCQASLFFLVYFQPISSFFCSKLYQGLHQCLSLTRIGYKCGSTLSLLIGVMGFGIVWWTTFCPCKVHIHEFKVFGMPSLAFLGFQVLITCCLTNSIQSMGIQGSYHSDFTLMSLTGHFYGKLICGRTQPQVFGKLASHKHTKCIPYATTQKTKHKWRLHNSRHFLLDKSFIYK